MALTASEDQFDAVAGALDIDGADAASVAAGLEDRDGDEAVAALQAAGVAASTVSDASDQVTDQHLWARGFFDALEAGSGIYPHAGPAFGGGPRPDSGAAHHVGEDNGYVLGEVAGYSADEVAALEESGVVGTQEHAPERPLDAPERVAVRVDRGELSRVDDDFGGWRSAAGTSS